MSWQRICKLPVLTAFVCVTSGATGILWLNTGAVLGPGWALADATELWNGSRLWSIVTCTWVHSSWPHLVWDLVWIGALGAIVEQTKGAVVWLVLYVGACLISNAACLFFEGGTGIGASGVSCAFFGAAWACRKTDPAIERALPPLGVVLFLSLVIADLAETLARPNGVYN